MDMILYKCKRRGVLAGLEVEGKVIGILSLAVVKIIADRTLMISLMAAADSGKTWDSVLAFLAQHNIATDELCGPFL